jgi:hypothetical protein
MDLVVAVRMQQRQARFYLCAAIYSPFWMMEISSCDFSNLLVAHQTAAYRSIQSCAMFSLSFLCSCHTLSFSAEMDLLEPWLLLLNSAK